MDDFVVDEFPGCCGFRVIDTFGDPSDVTEDVEDKYGDSNEVPMKPRAAVQETVRVIKSALKNFRGGVVATTVASQTHAIGALRQLGFTPVRTKFKRRITLWYLNKTR